MNRNNQGFTLAEMLIVVAITVILMGVAFIGVQSYQRSSTRLEFDTIAKEIFIAAQNHLTTAQSQGYLQLSEKSDSKSDERDPLGTHETSSFDTSDERYLVYKAVDTYSTNPQEVQSMLDLMLPFGAIDETVRAGGTYIIRYQPSSGRVLDVFYSLPGKSSMLTVSGVKLIGSNYSSLMASGRSDTAAGRSFRERFRGTIDDKSVTGVVGWYGGEEGLPIGTRLKDPEIVVHNEEVLWIEVNDNNAGEGSLKLLITGVTSGAQKSFLLNPDSENGQIRDENRVSNGSSGYEIILDDITSEGLHFANLSADDTSKHFIPGEDIIIEAVAYNNGALTNVAYSGKKTTNSLFADLQEKTESGTLKHTASIENFRHLENLDADISNLDSYDAGNKLNVVSSVQIKDLCWTNAATEIPTEKPDAFIEAVWNITGTKPSSIYDNDDNPVTTGSCYYPVSPDYLTEYDGQNHSVLNLRVNHDGNAGMFGTLVGASIKNVIVRNEVENDTDASFEIKGTGKVGGLVGSMTGGSVTNCAAAVYVNGETAGGLIGSMSDGTVSSSYSGGHTKEGQYLTKTTSGEAARMNVIATNVGGGMIGDAGSAEISNSYSTCSAAGSTAGGFVGTASGNISNCYCTGLVVAPTDPTENHGAFAGSVESGFSASGCQYFEIINELKDTVGYTYLKAVNNAEYSGITAFDETAATYEKFCGDKDVWDAAKPYDTGDKGLDKIYGNQFNLRTIAQISQTTKEKTDEEPKFLSTHYGDWPAPEEFVFN